MTSAKAFADQLEQQRALVAHRGELLEHQRELLAHQRAEAHARRNAVLREVYATWLARADVWVDRVISYGGWLKKEGAGADRPVRAAAQASALDAWNSMFSRQWEITLADADEERTALVATIATPIRLEPQGADTHETQKTHADQLLVDGKRRSEMVSDFANKLRAELAAAGRSRSE